MRLWVLKLLVVLALGLGLLIGASPTAGAGEWCLRVGLPTPIPDVKTCVPTY